MNFTNRVITQPVEILKNDHYVGKPITLNFTAVTADSNGQKIVKAGTPINASGVADNTATAVGVLLKDVYSGNPNGTIVIHGFIETAKAAVHSGVTIAAAVKTALPLVSFQ
jgi:hypothetical protein